MKSDQLSVALTFLAIFSVPTVFSAPFATQPTCSPVCRISPESSKLKYEQGHSYIYNFETKIATKLVGTSDEESIIKVKGKAVIAAQTPCDLILTVQQSVIEGPSGKKVSGETELEGSSIRFGFQDGSVEGICVESGESVWASNFKRALVTAFQNKAVQAVADATIMEVDIFGRCPTEYSFTDKSYTKTRDLNKCTYREGGKWILQGIPYNIPSEQNSNPIIDSDLTCTQELSPQGYFSSIKCLETNKVRALASGQAGAQNIIDTKLTYVQTKDSIPAIKSSVEYISSSLLFDHSNLAGNAKARRATTSNALDLLKKLCSEVSSGTVSSKVPGIFLQLKKTLSSAGGEDFVSIYDKIQDGSVCSSSVGKEKLFKLYVDAAIATASTESIELVATLIEQGKLSRHTQEIFVLYSSFITRPEEPAIKAFNKLLSLRDIPNNFLLAASGLLHQYCKTTNPDCGSNEQYDSLAVKIALFAAQNCNAQTRDASGTQKAVTAFQALGNLDVLPEDAVGMISKCLKSSTISNRMKMKALDGFRNDPCQKDLKALVFSTFKNKELPSEVRIQAYLSSVRCLQREDIDALQKALDDEDSNQVGAFVTSHIANAASNTNPGKRGARLAFKQIRLRKSFPMDPRIFSKNFDISAFSAERNVGFSAEGNLIYNQDSFIPRVTTGNLTVDVYGRSYQLFEYGVYLENFEKLFESYFGAAGLFSKNPETDVVKELHAQLSDFQSEVLARFKRDTNPSEIDAIHNEVSDIRPRYTANGGFGDIYVRTLGQSIFSETFTQEQIMKQTLPKTFLTILDKILEGAKDHSVEITEPINFLNDEVTIPTISGFPLNLQIEGTTVLSLQLQGKLDILALMGRREGGRDTEVKSRVLPSAATVIKAKMSVGAGPIESGLQLEGKIHTSSGIDVAITKQSNKFEFKFNIPEEKIQLVDISSELFFVEQTADEGHKKSPLKSKLEERSILDNQCSEALSGVTGMKFCAHIKVPTFKTDGSPFFPLTGNSVLSLSMKKVDAAMEGYYVKVERGSESETEKTVSIVMDTPGSRANRKITANARYLLGQSPKVELDIASPWSSVRMDYQRWNEELLQGMELTAKADEMVVSAVAKLKHIPNGEIGIRYEPEISYSFMGSTVKILDGSVTRVFGKTMDIDLKADGGLRAIQGKLSGSVQINRKDARNADFALSSIQIVNDALGKLFFDGSIGLKPTGSTIDLKAKYGLEEAEHDFTLGGEYNEPSPKSKMFEIKVASTRREFLNFDLRYESARSPNGFENTMLIHRGSDVGTRLTVSQSSKYNWESSKEFDIENLLQITYPKRSVDFYLKADAKNGATQSANFQLRSGADSNAVVTYDATGDDFNNYDLIGSLTHPGIKVKFSEIGKKVSQEKWNYKSAYSSIIDGKSPFNLDVETDLTLRYQKSDILSELDTKLTSTAFSEPIMFNSKVNAQPEFYLASMKLGKASGDILSLATEYRAALGNNPSTVNSKAFIASYLDAKLTGTRDKVTNLNVDVTWVPTSRKITLNSDLKKQRDQYIVVTDIKWDATRDQTKSANIKNTIVFPKGSIGIETTSDFTVAGRTSQLVFNGRMGSDYYNGENAVDIVFKDSGSQNYKIALSNKNENKDKTKGMELGVKLDFPRQSPFELKLKNRAANMDFANFIFELSADLNLAYRDNKKLNLQAELNSLLTNKRTVNGKWDISGSGITSMRLDHTLEMQSGHFKTAVSATRGRKSGDLVFETSYDLISPKKTVEYKYVINTPYPAYRTLEMGSKYTYIFTHWTNFDISQSGSVTLNNGNPSTWDNAISFLGKEFQTKYNITAAGNPIIAFRLSSSISPKKVNLKIQNGVKEGDIKLNIDLERNFPNLNFRTVVHTPYKGYENMDLRIRNKLGSNAQSYDTDIQAKRGSERFTISSKYENGPTKKSIDLTVSGDNSPARKVYLSLKGPDSNKYSVDVVLRWGDSGRIITTKGELLRSGQSLVGDLTLDSPVLNAEGWNIHIAQDLKKGRHNFEIRVKNAEEETGHLILDYSKSGTEALSRYDGTMNILARSVDFEGQFKVDAQEFLMSRDGEEGGEVKTIINFSTENYPIRLEFLGKRTNADSKFSASFCNEGDQDCKSMDFSILTTETEYTMTFSSKSSSADMKPEADTFIFRTVSGDTAEHSITLRSTGELEQVVGYKIFRYPGLRSAGFEITLPERKVAVIMSERDSAYSLDAWTNKKQNPEDKMSIVFRKEEITRVDDANGWGREMSLVLKHPELQKDLRITTTAFYGGAKTLADISAEVDIFKSGQEVTASLKVDREITSRAEGSNLRVYAIDLGLHSKDQVLSADLHTDISASGIEFTSKSKLKYVNREKKQRDYEIVLDYVPDHRAFEVIGPSGRIISYSSSYTFHSTPGYLIDGYDVRREIFLPGMADTRIFQNSLTTSFPPSAHIKMFTVSSPPGQFYEAWIGFKNERHFASGIYGHEEQDQLTLGDFNIALNNTRLLFLKADWDNNNIKDFLMKATNRLEDTAARFKDISGASVDYLTKEIDFQSSALLKSLPPLRPILKALKQQVKEVKDEFTSAEIVQRALDYFELVLNIMGTDFEELIEQFNEMTVFYAELFENMQKFVERIPEMFWRGVESIPDAWESAQQSISVAFDTMVNSLSYTLKLISEAVENLSKANPSVAENIGIFSDTTQGIGKVLKEAVSSGVKVITDLWSSLKASTQQILDSEPLKGILGGITKRYESMLGNAIEDYKQQLDILRESIMKTLSRDEEFRQLFQAVLEYAEKKTKDMSVDDMAAQTEIYEKFLNALEKASSSFFNVDLKDGLIVAQLPLPVPVQSLLDIDQVFAVSLPEKLPTSKFTLSEIWKAYSRIRAWRDLTPPFEKFAYVVGSQYFRSFDGKFNHFEGDCQYVLAADFAEKNFTILVDFKKDTGSEVKKSIVMTDGKNTVVIQPDNSVLLNGKSTQSVYEGEHRIFQAGDWVTVEFGDSFNVECSKLQDVCTFQLNGIYLGKTRGLLGTYNNEIYDDLMSPSGVIQDTFEKVVPLWKVNRRCQERPLPNHSPARNLDAVEMCKSAFGESSSLSSCYETEDPKEYETVCTALAEEKGYDVQRAVCTAAYSYVKSCQNSGVETSSSKFCQK